MEAFRNLGLETGERVDAMDFRLRGGAGAGEAASCYQLAALV